MYFTPSAWRPLTRISAPRNSCVTGAADFEFDAAVAEAISALDISMMNLCEFL
jgi:hypothetical protein